ncbi:hypothetical protein N7G274_009459 [Stereocaulon virgatum]|uniref:Uncharacterized protein n=1 Tax=Stereocaulon virgatum TaxID=373712 RepID=A0ABR3ZX38_9LECA
MARLLGSTSIQASMDAELQDAELQDAELQDAKLQDAELQDAELQDAELQDVTGLAVFLDHVRRHGTSGLWRKRTRGARMDPDLQVFKSLRAIANTTSIPTSIKCFATLETPNSKDVDTFVFPTTDPLSMVSKPSVTARTFDPTSGAVNTPT